MRIVCEQQDDGSWRADLVDLPGTPVVGMGANYQAAIGSLLVALAIKPTEIPPDTDLKFYVSINRKFSLDPIREAARVEVERVLCNNYVKQAVTGLVNKIDLRQTLMDVFGPKEFTKVTAPFERFLICKHCNYRAHITQMSTNPAVGLRFEILDSSVRFSGVCPSCRTVGRFLYDDVPIAPAAAAWDGLSTAEKVATVKADVEEKRAAGWTRNDFAEALDQEFLGQRWQVRVVNDLVPMHCGPAYLFTDPAAACGCDHVGDYYVFPRDIDWAPEPVIVSGVPARI